MSSVTKRSGFSIQSFDDGTKIISGPCKTCLAMIEDTVTTEGLPDDWYCLSCWTQVERSRLREAVKKLTDERDAMASAMTQAIAALESGGADKATVTLRSAMAGVYRDGVAKLRERVSDLEKKLFAVTAQAAAAANPSVDGLRRQNTALLGVVSRLRNELETAQVKYTNIGSTLCAERLLDIAINGRSGGVFGGSEVEVCAQEIEALKTKAAMLEKAIQAKNEELDATKKRLQREIASRRVLERAFGAVRDHASKHDMSDIIFVLDDSLYGV